MLWKVRNYLIKVIELLIFLKVYNIYHAFNTLPHVWPYTGMWGCTRLIGKQ